MKLIDDWKKVLKTSWTVRASIIAGGLTGIAAILPLLGDVADPWALLAASFLVSSLTPLLRILSQKKEDPDDSAEP